MYKVSNERSDSVKKMCFRTAIITLLFLVLFIKAGAQDRVRYTGTRHSDIAFSDGRLPHAAGVHNIQILRANRERPELADGYGWTYNHGPDIAFWNGRFYLSYLSNPHSEHIQPGQTLLTTSDDGYSWKMPVIVFPPYKIKEGTKKIGTEFVSYSGMHSVMHQRMSFYVSKSNRLLTLGYYGFSFGPRDSPNDGNGIGRVVREIYKDGSFGEIYFIRYNRNFSESNTSYPLYSRSKDRGFVEACNELLANRLIVQQWREEQDRDDKIISLPDNRLKAFSFYHLNDKRVVGLWKKGYSAISSDEGASWTSPEIAENLITGGGKVWGQRTSDGRYALLFNPDDIERFPLAILTSDNGLDYDNLLSVHGDVSPCRYKGVYKDYGPSYFRGFTEGNGVSPDGKIWVTYSVNKEDIWVSSIAVPVKSTGQENIADDFSKMMKGKELEEWNIYSPLWAPVRIEAGANNEKSLALRDRDTYDYAKVERIFKPGSEITAAISIIPRQNDGELHIELQDSEGNIAVKVIFDSNGEIKVSNRMAFVNFGSYEKEKLYTIKLKTLNDGRVTLSVNGKERNDLRIVASGVNLLERIVLRTGSSFGVPSPDPVSEEESLQIDPGHRDLPFASEIGKESVFLIKSVAITSKQ